MVNKIVAFTFCILMVYGFIETFTIQFNFLNNFFLTIDKSISEGKENIRNELEKEKNVWNNQIVPQNEYQVEFDSFNRLNQNSDDNKKFFVITAIFNPASTQSRNNLYQTFVRHMNDTGAQLITIECIFPLLNQTEFQVTDADNPFHIQLKSESVYWMKENLINIAVSRLPPHAKWVCWLDADIEFENHNWVKLTIERLHKYTVLQMFETVRFMGPAPENEILKIGYSFGYSVVHNKTADLRNRNVWYAHPGYGWGMAVKDFREINGLPYYVITGSGDSVFACSLLKAKSYPFDSYKKKLHPEYLKMIIDKMSFNYPKLLEISKSQKKNILGYLPVTLRHYWHGASGNRKYKERWGIVAADKFNFNTDVTITEDGLIKFNPNKANLQNRFIEFKGYKYP